MEHGIVCRKPNSLFGYFGWGSVARIDEHTLIAACSGQRTRHVCPFGKTELFYSFDDGKTWSEPMVVNDTILDDRDAGIVHLGGKRLALTWFNHPLRSFVDAYTSDPKEELCKVYMDVAEPEVKERCGSWLRLSEDGGFSWGEPIKMEISSPHGPTVLRDGTLLYLGKGMYSDRVEHDVTSMKNYYLDPEYRDEITAWSSVDGKTWTELGTVPMPEGASCEYACEPHAIELADGRILGMIRYHIGSRMTMLQTWSEDGGKTWSVPTYTDVCGAPPHLLQHSSGAVICVYGRREDPFGERAMISYDGGKTWAKDVELNSAKDLDLGYPCSVELADGSILTVYYQAYGDDFKRSFLYTHWSLDEV